MLFSNCNEIPTTYLIILFVSEVNCFHLCSTFSNDIIKVFPPENETREMRTRPCRGVKIVKSHVLVIYIVFRLMARLPPHSNIWSTSEFLQT
jgi:hypothetical protein